jgi:hypothetical protein
LLPLGLSGHRTADGTTTDIDADCVPHCAKKSRCNNGRIARIR